MQIHRTCWQFGWGPPENNWGPRSMFVPERQAEGDAAQADHLDYLFMNGVLIDEKKVTNMESGFGHQLKNSGPCSCRARQMVYS